MRLLIQGGQVFDEGRVFAADVLIEDGWVKAVGEGLDAEGAEVLDAGGCLVSPGFTDLHVHLREPGFAEKETIATGTAAAAAGGFTTVCAMPNLDPVPDSVDSLQKQLDAIAHSARVRVLPYGALSVGELGRQLADIGGMGRLVAGFSDDGRGVQSDEMMRAAMAEVAKIAIKGRENRNGIEYHLVKDSFVAAHCELDSLLPPPGRGTCVQEGCAFAQRHGYAGHSNASEAAEVQRDIRLAAETGCRLHICHTSAAESFAAIRTAKAEGVRVSCEVTPHNLLLSCDDITEDDGRFKMNPPLRGEADRQAAIAAVLDGTVDAIATDHAPHTPAEKAGGFAKSLNGVVGLETAFPAVYTGLVRTGIVPLERVLQLLTAWPRRVLSERQGWVREGQRADLVVLDLASERVVEPDRFLTKGRATPFAGRTLAGWPVLTFANGSQVYRR